MSPGTKALLKGFPATLSNIFGFLWQHLPLVPARSATAIAVIPPVESFKAGLHGPLPGPLPAPKRPSARLVEPVDILPEWGMCSSVLFSKQVLNNFRRSFTFTPRSLVGLGSTE